METFKKAFTIISLFIATIVISIGIFFIIEDSLIDRKIKNEGIQTIGTIKSKWRGRCGSGSGNSATFKIIIRGFEREFIEDCGVPEEVEIGDRYYVKYLIDDPTQNIIFFDKKITIIPEK